MLKDFKSEIKLFVLVAFVAAVVSIGGILLLQAMQQPTPVAQTPSPPSPEPSVKEETYYTRLETCRYGILGKEKYLDEYILQPGDTLLSIAKKQLGSASRINEVVFLNYKQYPSIYTDYNSIEFGWKFYLPPRFLERTSGSLIGYTGKLTQGTYGPQLLLNYQDSSESFRTPFNVWDDTLYFGDFAKEKLQEGDCVAIIVDTLPGNIALAVFPQYQEVDSLVRLELDWNTPNYEYNYSYEYRSPCDYENLQKLGFPEYVVKQGDSLYSIAREQLGDEERAIEIREINKARYPNLYPEKWAPSLYESKDFLEVQWELILPPKNPTLEAQRQASTCWYGLKQQPTSPAVISTFDTSGWQIYRNDEFGFELRYPEVFAKSEGCKPRQIDSATIAIGNRITIQISDSEGQTVEVYINDLFSKLKEQFSPEAVMNEIKKSSAQLGGMPAVHIAWGSLGYHIIETRYAVKNGEVYFVSLSAGPNCSLADASGILEPSVFDQILSTFRFVE